jgi:arginine decarboxylase
MAAQHAAHGAGAVSGRELDVVVTSGTGTAPTELVAFDAALQAAAVAHLNLIRLSSRIPPRSRVNVPQRWSALAGAWGDRLFRVYAEHRVSASGERVGAGLGWVQQEKTGAGVLVEHHGDDQSAVEAQPKATPDDLAARRPGRYRGAAWGIACAVCGIAAVVVAAIRVEPW